MPRLLTGKSQLQRKSAKYFAHGETRKSSSYTLSTDQNPSAKSVDLGCLEGIHWIVVHGAERVDEELWEETELKRTVSGRKWQIVRGLAGWARESTRAMMPSSQQDELAE